MRTTLKSLLALTLLILSSSFVSAQTGRLLSLSARFTCGTGDAVAVTEFILQGTGTETVLLRGIGPSLVWYGVPDPLQDPMTRLLDGRGRTRDFSDDWMDNPDKDAIIATGLAPVDPRESAMIDTLGPGSYTMVEQGKDRSTGAALPEIYDLSDGSLQLSAIGVRGSVLPEVNVLFNGFIIAGTSPATVLLRALGPTLAGAGLTGVLDDPIVEVYDSSGSLVASNDNWRDTQESEIITTGLAPADDRESAIVANFSPGAYTAVVHGINSTTGLAFFQIYSLAFPPRELNPAPPLRSRR